MGYFPPNNLLLGWTLQSSYESCWEALDAHYDLASEHVCVLAGLNIKHPVLVNTTPTSDDDTSVSLNTIPTSGDDTNEINEKDFTVKQ